MAARKNTFDDKLARLHTIPDAPEAEAIAELRKLLAETNVFLVGEAAKLAKQLELRDLENDLVSAAQRLLTSKDLLDRGCIAKRNLFDALVHFEVHVPDLYLAGLRHFQIEHSFGPPEDTAGPIRGLCAHALVRIDFPEAILEIAPLLFDDRPEARVAAAEALASTGDQNCAAILHTRILAGEDEPDALGAIYRSLLALAPKRYLPLVTIGLQEGQDAAALALGESRLPQAFSILKSALEKAHGDLESAICLSLALLRTEEATNHLRELAEHAPENKAARALEALALHRHDTRLTDQIRQIVNARKSKKLARLFSEKFGGAE